jgi:hypothetical protein
MVMTKEEKNEYMKNYYREKNKDPLFRKKQNDRRRVYQRRVRMKVIEVLGGCCANPYGLHDKPFSDWRCLQIDHVKGNGHSYRNMRLHLDTSSINLYHKIIREVKSGSKDYQLLCANCNWIKKYENHEVGAKN